MGDHCHLGSDCRRAILSVTKMISAVTPIITAVTILALIAAVAVLTWHGDITGEAAVAFFGTLGGGGAAAGVSHVATKTGASAARQTRRE